MRAKLALALLSLVLCAWMPTGPVGTTQVPDDPAGAWEPGLNCTGRIDIPLIQNAIETKWSPDNKTLAITAGQRTPPPTSPLGWKKDEVIYTPAVRTRSLSPWRLRSRP